MRLGLLMRRVALDRCLPKRKRVPDRSSTLGKDGVGLRIYIKKQVKHTGFGEERRPLGAHLTVEWTSDFQVKLDEIAKPSCETKVWSRLSIAIQVEGKV